MSRTIDKALTARYRALDKSIRLPIEGEDAIRPDLLIVFPYRGPARAPEVVIETDEFSAVCPWTGLPDQGALTITYTPRRLLLELKSLKHYLLTFRQVGIVQEHAAARILRDLARAAKPARMTVTVDYNVRGGLHTVVTVRHPQRPAPKPQRTQRAQRQ
ncbi:MAG: NADPH-dependent 7-cyano-7-deazaguanine reductase QueF [Deltaproteobacteria bacterium]|nr:NADPH-dependent 7-cyano-7-deazaguanine reductase QueF [Deltaproteobacteria bacterium]